MSINCGIYKIECSGFILYIGATTSLPERKKCQLHRLRKGVNPNKALQEYYNKGGKDITFTLIEECGPNIHVERKQFYVDMLNPKFNIHPAYKMVK